MSCMVPFWASTDSGSVPIWGPRPKPRRPEEIVYILNDSCSHFTQRLTVHTIHRISFILIIHHIHMYIHIFIYMSYSRLNFFRSSRQAGCSRILVSDTVLITLFRLNLNHIRIIRICAFTFKSWEQAGRVTSTVRRCVQVFYAQILEQTCFDKLKTFYNLNPRQILTIST
jgi:hypothetical protein